MLRPFRRFQALTGQYVSDSGRFVRELRLCLESVCYVMTIRALLGTYWSIRVRFGSIRPQVTFVSRVRLLRHDQLGRYGKIQDNNRTRFDSKSCESINQIITNVCNRRMCQLSMIMLIYESISYMNI